MNLVRGSSPCCHAPIYFQVSPLRVKCACCHCKVDPLDVIDPCGQLIRAVCKEEDRVLQG